jgi:two-component system, NarL family, nitrate/nitrite response regulator NarL
MTAPIRLVLVDDHPIVLQGLQRLFERYSDFEVVGSYGSGDDALAGARAHDPDVMVLDLRMPGRNGLDVLRSLRETASRCRVVLLTAAMRDEEMTQALELDAAGIVLKESSPEALVECVRTVRQGKNWIDPEMLGRGIGIMRRPRPPGMPPDATLTAREREIVRLVAQGMRNREIAQRLSISEGTVKIHLHNAYDKFGVDGRLELVLAAQQKGLL